MPPSSPIMEPLKERAGWCAGYLGEEAVAEMRPLLQENAGQDGIEMKVEPTGWGSDDPELEEDDTGPDPVRVLMLPLQAQHAMEKMEEFVLKVWEGRWRVMPYDVLPDWLKDNDFLLHGHRPPMPSFRACFRSIFRLHTETGNIWTHLLGFLFFLVLGIGYMFSPNMKYVAPIQERVVFGMFFLGAILCLCFSWLFHTVYCHSEKVSRTFSKLDYSGIALLTMGSFVPWLYYSFYCSPQPQLIYLIIICVLGITAIMVSQWDHFATPQYRAVRAVPFSPDLPRLGGRSCLCPSSRGLPAAGIPLIAGWQLHGEHCALIPFEAQGTPLLNEGSPPVTLRTSGYGPRGAGPLLKGTAPSLRLKNNLCVPGLLCGWGMALLSSIRATHT
ncbi:adiponectin receptor protein 1-like isoform X1 [Ahaetulla prasina]|uniref:adiponectin receptor protein 1-like isoform X1 n=1 Tax=Ahaetulla prasina TaxID=499056 RepID=UPI00264710B2|nr:adiponectin receptor protein 1-like isoform X1 [Ahaetulla prasina]XP_058030036.1 adiponectin receptor protein 1-like isoform X1 [Ahaetulla prasina]XP_058030037.1 adiponectin receptor protein 1-like isoform X1 [Ahaetulla prasina]